jgi:RNA polymerase sigma-70 factor (ECF subfamily)
MSDADTNAARASEQELIRRCQSGESDAWDELFDLHYDAVGRYVFQLMPSFRREDVQEVCQETFLSVVRRLASFASRSRLQTWIFRIAANKARDYLEHQRAMKRGGGQVPISMDAADPESGLKLDPPSALPGPEARTLAREQLEQLRLALDAVGDPCREIIELRYFADLSYQEIGDSLALNLKTVSSRLSKCLDKLEVAVRHVLSRESSPEPSV